ncbi:MAG: hypothetical protein V3S25_08325 [Nitrospirales bacterium]
MARKGRTDRGLLMKKDATGKPRWYVRAWHLGKAWRFGSFHTKTAAQGHEPARKLRDRLPTRMAPPNSPMLNGSSASGSRHST